MEDFIGREEDLRILQETYEGRKYKACTVIGRRRIGKSSLIEKFVEDKEHIYFQFVETGFPEVNLRHMEYIMGLWKGTEVAYRDFTDAFNDLSKEAMRQKITIVFDEFTYALSYSPFSALTKNLIDRGLEDSFLIICGSAVRMMEAEIEDTSKPLFGRTRRIDIKGMTLHETAGFHPDMTHYDLLRLYILSNGSPYYLADTPAGTFREYMERYVLPERSFFHNEGENMIRREFGDPDRYIQIMESMARGRNTVSTISDHTRIDVTSCRRFMDQLVSVGIIERLRPMLGSPEKPVRYRIKDGMAGIHFRVLRGRVFGTRPEYGPLENMINTEFGRLFEPFCMDLIRRRYNVLDIGTWFGKISITDEEGAMVRDDAGRPVTEETDIDVVAEIAEGRVRTTLFAECKMRISPAGMAELDALDRKLENIRFKGNYRRCIISAGGFTEGLKEYALMNDVLLIDSDVLFGINKIPFLNIL